MHVELGRPSSGLQVAPHASEAKGSFINGKLTERPQFTIDDEEPPAGTAVFTAKQPLSPSHLALVAQLDQTRALTYNYGGTHRGHSGPERPF